MSKQLLEILDCVKNPCIIPSEKLEFKYEGMIATIILKNLTVEYKNSKISFSCEKCDIEGDIEAVYELDHINIDYPLSEVVSLVLHNS